MYFSVRPLHLYISLLAGLDLWLEVYWCLPRLNVNPELASSVCASNTSSSVYAFTVTVLGRNFMR